MVNHKTVCIEERPHYFYYLPLLQHLLYYHRKKCVQQIMTTGRPKTCSISLEKIGSSFQNRWEVENDSRLQEYAYMNVEVQKEIDESSESSVTTNDNEIEELTIGINKDTAAGPDNILIGVLKKVDCFNLLALMATKILRNGFVPESLKLARTVLIYKKGDKNECSNWRTISVCSIIRRIIERVVERKLRRFIQLNENQRGFMAMPGTFINTSLVDCVLKSAKQDKKDVAIVFLDILQAYDNVGHEHLIEPLKTFGITTPLHTCISNLIKGNCTQIQTAQGKSKKIFFKRGVFQGSPLCPILFNVAINPILDNLSENTVSDHFGYQIQPDLPTLSVAGFADDTTLIARGIQEATELVMQAKHSFEELGMRINFSKSNAIILEKVILVTKDINLGNDDIIRSISTNDTIKYLGVNFREEIIFDEDQVMKNLHADLEKLVSTQMLHPHQKIKIMCEYIWPKVVYPFQNAPLSKLRKVFLEKMDVMIRSIAKEIIGSLALTKRDVIFTKKCKRLGFT